MSAERDLHRRIVDNLSDGLYYVDRDRRITYWNHGAERLSGFCADEVVGRRCRDGILMHTDGEGHLLCGSDCPLLATMRDGRRRECHVFMRHKEGHREPVWVRAEPIRDEDGAIVGAVEIFNDDSEATAARQQLHELERQALSDPATGIGNRRYLEATLQARLGEAERYGWEFGLLFVDIDHFKRVNDRHGHEIGDRVLKMVASTLTYSTRSSDAVGRWGGEEFVIVLPGVDEQSLRQAAERSRLLLRQSRLPAESGSVGVTVSVGGTLALHGDTADGLVDRADQLMYESKQRGRDHVTLDGDG